MFARTANKTGHAGIRGLMRRKKKVQPQPRVFPGPVGFLFEGSGEYICLACKERLCEETGSSFPGLPHLLGPMRPVHAVPGEFVERYCDECGEHSQETLRRLSAP